MGKRFLTEKRAIAVTVGTQHCELNGRGERGTKYTS